MELQAVKVDVRIVFDHSHRFIETPVGDSEFVLVKTGGDVMVGVRVNIRINTQAHRRLAAKPPGDVAHNLNFLERLHDKCPDPDLECLANLLVGLGHAGKKDLFRIIPAADSEIDLIPAHAISADPSRADYVVEAAVRVRLE